MVCVAVCLFFELSGEEVAYSCVEVQAYLAS